MILLITVVIKKNKDKSSIMNDTQFNLVLEGLKRMVRREELQSKPEHATLKDQREKRDQLKDKKFLAQQKKSTLSTKGDE